MRTPARRRSHRGPSRPRGLPRRIILAAVLLPLAVGVVTPAQAAGKSQADLRVTMAAPSSASTGDQFDYSVTVANDGPAKATSVVVEDTLPPQVTLLSVSPAAACTGTTSVRCELGVLPAGASSTVVLTVRADAAGDATNHATATARQQDPALDDNAASTTTTVSERADPDPGQPAPDSCRVSLRGGPSSCTFTYTGNRLLFVALAVTGLQSGDYVSLLANKENGSAVAGCTLRKLWFGPSHEGACVDERTHTGIGVGGGELPPIDVDEISEGSCVTTAHCATIWQSPLPAPGTALTCKLSVTAGFTSTAEGVCRG